MEAERTSGQEGRKEMRKGGRKEGRLVCDIQAPHALRARKSTRAWMLWGDWRLAQAQLKPKP
jgi:hypothetical protein